MLTTVRTTELSGGRCLTWRTATRADADLVWSWWNAPHVWYWSIGQRLGSVGVPPYTSEHVAEYLESRSGAVIASVDDGPPAVYAELYPVLDSPLATVAEPTARGLHVLIGDNRPPRPPGIEVAASLIDWQFAEHPAARQVVVDPDVRDTRARDLATRLGMTPLTRLSTGVTETHVAAVSRAEWYRHRASVLAA